MGPSVSSDGMLPLGGHWEWMDAESQLSPGGQQQEFARSSKWWQTFGRGHGQLLLHFLGAYAALWRSNCSLGPFHCRQYLLLVPLGITGSEMEINFASSVPHLADKMDYFK